MYKQSMMMMMMMKRVIVVVNGGRACGHTWTNAIVESSELTQTREDGERDVRRFKTEVRVNFGLSQTKNGRTPNKTISKQRKIKSITKKLVESKQIEREKERK